MTPETHRYIIAGAFLIMGILHFLKPKFFVQIMPDYIPWHLAMVYISGVAEVLGAIGILVPQTQTLAAWGLILLLVTVFPANINMAVTSIKKSGLGSWYSMLLLLRLPLQFVIMYWVYWACLR